ncbi:uncharacterized protein EV422DRAFT_522828 [Fimicolochytrium jonesii]|uniref:uncharacterized protein n=1 Tax=Fimicolochytrium jonesii TaxID=1396493 RepID=UPI0022FE7A2C|nr:uncharacterized protein EV422DRAFT_522828 [Fimicolochytrium jonesii]KAI8822958.1 hypothetical protein EV422DRAFT_522828 [Fimicolochytrium jonesii]
MFPRTAQIAHNTLGLLQLSLALLQCLRERRFLPTASRLTSRYSLQLRYHFHIYIAFYILELVFSDVVTEFPNMAVHHIVAIAIFLGALSDFGSLSAITLVPFLLHAVFWTLGQGVSFTLLAVYNMGFGCIILLLVANNTRPPHRRWFAPVAWPVVTMGGLEVCVNYVTYCLDYEGVRCPNIQDGRMGVAQICLAVAAGTVIILAGTLGYMQKDKETKRSKKI